MLYEVITIYNSLANEMLENDFKVKDELLAKLAGDVSEKLKKTLGPQIAEISKKQLYVDEADAVILRQINALKLDAIEKQIKEISESDSYNFV